MTKNLENSLDKIRESIIAGDYKKLPLLLENIQTLEHEIESTTRESAHRVKEKAERGLQCLQAAIAGLHAGKRRADDITAAISAISTYNKSGHKLLLPARNPAGQRL